jgi:hypothetical protein
MALNAGFTAPIVMALGGWRSERMMRRYAAVTDETLRRAAEAVARNGKEHVSCGEPLKLNVHLKELAPLCAGYHPASTCRHP